MWVVVCVMVESCVGGWVVGEKEGGQRCLVSRCGRWVWRGGCGLLEASAKEAGREDGEAGANCGRGVALALVGEKAGRQTKPRNKRLLGQAPTICLRLLQSRMRREVSLDFARHVMYSLTRQHVMHSWISCHSTNKGNSAFVYCYLQSSSSACSEAYLPT